MREILFRGKRTDNGEWIEGFYTQKMNPYTPNGLPIKHFILDLAPFGADVLPETIGQFTGLTDKNGTKIFEGDIIKHNIKCSEIVKTYIVEWESRLSKFVGRYMGDEYYGHKYAYAEIHEELIYEVIGNIYDNPELMKGGEK